MKSLNKLGPSQQISLFKIMSLSWVKRRMLVEIVSLFFVILFLYTGISKLLDFDVFKGQLEESPVLEKVAPMIAWGLPITEFAVSILLFFPKYRLKGLYATFALMIGFTLYVIALLATSTELPCSCGGIIEELSWPGHLIFNGTLTLLAFTSIVLQKKIYKEDQNKPF